ncbi:DUF2513 domain-containing protein [Anabaena sp. UHCC 0187]|uniref:DUF2513 domain-containing protein n=1 Tax=Anabaena sp. UHCC 0187 TaxID=2590018 RepID=UPI001446B191|nr:DUF2513 domain-containing protein [Anabaena sp. UHCC 0187]MTJ13019.1 DUF2513 domain-containing protein [Anabaena sp. UHCC 0187]
MKRDWNLVRQILLQAESYSPGVYIESFTCEGFDEATIIEHIEIMIESKLLDGEIDKTQAGTSGFLVHKITWEGHNFLDNAKNDTIWKKVMAEAKEKGTSTSFVVLNGLLTKAAQKYAGLG